MAYSCSQKPCNFSEYPSLIISVYAETLGEAFLEDITQKCIIFCFVLFFSYINFHLNPLKGEICFLSWPIVIFLDWMKILNLVHTHCIHFYFPGVKHPLQHRADDCWHWALVKQFIKYFCLSMLLYFPGVKVTLHNKVGGCLSEALAILCPWKKHTTVEPVLSSILLSSHPVLSGRLSTSWTCFP